MNEDVVNRQLSFEDNWCPGLEEETWCPDISLGEETESSRRGADHGQREMVSHLCHTRD